MDVLRGLALLGIALANFPEFSLYSFLSVEAADAMPTAGIDRVVHYLQYIFIDGKFYTIFSLLFGIGFSIIIANAMKRGANGFRIFYRRMVCSAVDWFSAPDVPLERRHTDVVRIAGVCCCPCSGAHRTKSCYGGLLLYWRFP